MLLEMSGFHMSYVEKTISSGFMDSVRDRVVPSTSVCDVLEWSGSASAATLTKETSPARPCGWTWPWRVSPARNL